MSITYCFFDFRDNYKLQYYFENMGCDFATFADPDDVDQPFSKKCNKFANFMGRLPVLGRAVGPIRVSYGVVKVPLCTLGAFFAAFSAGVTRPFSKRGYYKCLSGARFCGNGSLDGIKHVGRGIIETIPIAGCYQFVQYDNQHIIEI